MCACTYLRMHFYVNVNAGMLYVHVYVYDVWVSCTSVYLWQLRLSGLKRMNTDIMLSFWTTVCLCDLCSCWRSLHSCIDLSSSLLAWHSFFSLLFAMKWNQCVFKTVWAGFQTIPSITTCLFSMMLYHGVTTDATLHRESSVWLRLWLMSELRRNSTVIFPLFFPQMFNLRRCEFAFICAA